MAKTDAAADVLFKVILVGDEGSVRNRILEQLGIDVLDTLEDYMKTIGTDIHQLTRIVDDINVKIVLWVLSNDAEFNQLRKAYYQNASMIVLSIEKCGRDSHARYEQIIDAVFSQTGPIPIAIVANPSETGQDEDALWELASTVDASQLILNLEDLDKLEEKVERLIRETLFTKDDREIPYILSFLRACGLPAAQKLFCLERETIIEAIRSDDYSSRVDNIVSSDELHGHFEAKRSSLFIDIDPLKETEYSVHIPEILENRASEIREIWVNETLRGKYDLRYLWLTAYGFEILRSLKVKLIVEQSEFYSVKEAFSELGFNLQVRKDNIYPKIKMSNELKTFVWELVKKL